MLLATHKLMNYCLIMAILIGLFRSNTTSIIQPMDKGVLKNLKTRYKRALLKKIVEEDSTPKQFVNELIIKDCITQVQKHEITSTMH